MCDSWQKFAFVTVTDRDGLRSWNPHDNIARYAKNDAPKPAIDDAKRGEIELREGGLDSCVQQRSYHRREIDHDTTLPT